MELKEVGCDIIVVCGTPPFLLKGLDFERQWGAELSSRTGLPIITSMEPHAIALKALGVRKVACATYYHNELNHAIVDYLARFGIGATMMGGFSLAGESEALYSTPMMALDKVSFMHVYDYCKRGVRRLSHAVDAIYINGSGWDAAPAVEVLERDIRIKVVWAQAADMWLTYHKLAISNPVSGYGSLLSGAYVPSD